MSFLEVAQSFQIATHIKVANSLQKLPVLIQANAAYYLPKIVKRKK